MQKLNLFIICIILTIGVQAQSNTKFIQKVAFEGHLGITELNISNKPNAVLDLMNYLDNKELDDPSYLTLGTHLWLRNKMEVDLEVSMDTYLFEFKQFYDLKVTSPLYKFVNLNLGFNKKLLLTNGVHPFFDEIPDYYSYQNYHEYNPLEFYGPYTGLNYTFEKKNWLFRADLNAGILYNKRTSLQVRLKELSSNFIKLERYEIHSTPGWWVSPEFYLAYTLHETKKMQLGCRVKSEYFVSKKGLNYKLTEYNWTSSNPIISEKVLPKHTISSFTADFGIFVRLK